MKSANRTKLAVLSVALLASCCSRRGALDPEAASETLPIVVQEYLDYVEADPNLIPEQKGDRQFAADALLSWWQAGVDAKEAAQAAEAGQ